MSLVSVMNPERNLLRLLLSAAAAPPLMTVNFLSVNECSSSNPLKNLLENPL